MRTIAVLCGLFFAAVVAWLHVARSDVSARTQGISHYAVGAGGPIMTASFVALAAGLACASLAVTDSTVVRPRVLGHVLLWLAALGLLVVAVAPVDAPGRLTTRGGFHTLGALLFFVAAAAGTVITSASLDTVTARIAWSLAAAVGVFLVGMSGAPGLFQIRGLLQRLCFALVVAWIVFVART